MTWKRSAAACPRSRRSIRSLRQRSTGGPPGSRTTVQKIEQDRAARDAQRLKAIAFHDPEARVRDARPDEMEATFLVEEILGRPSFYTNRQVDRAWKQARIAYLDSKRLHARQIIECHRRGVRALAKALLQEREIDATRAGEIIASTLSCPVRVPAIMRLGRCDYSPRQSADRETGRPKNEIRFG